MSAPKSTESPIKSPRGTGAESPTTVRPLDMDEDDVPETGELHTESATTTPAVEPPAPHKPPRPLSPQQQAENTLKEAFPSIDAAVVKAVLMASGGQVEPAFNALLGMSDPDAVVEQHEPPPPRQPPRPTAAAAPVAAPGATPHSQMEADELYARRLAEQYGGYEQPRSSRPGSKPPRGQNLKPNEMYDENHSFIDDDLPVIRENLRKGFIETQSTVNKWITNFKKRLDGEDIEAEPVQGRPLQGYMPQGETSQYGGRRSGDVRQSGDYNRYDADPQVLGDDFAGMQLKEDGTPQKRSGRPLANPDLFKPTPAAPVNADGRKPFQAGVEDSDIYSPPPKTTTPSTNKQSKWQPLSAVEPSPVGETDNDPFSLGDSEDEKESKDRVGGKEIKMEDTERLKSAAAKSEPAQPAKKLEPAATSGTKDKLAEEITK